MKEEFLEIKDEKITMKIEENGDKKTYINGKLNSYNDKPAVEYVNGTKEWYKDGVKHRDGGLHSAEYADGTKAWYKDGEIGRDGGLPAIEHPNGDKSFYSKNWLDYIEKVDGSKQYYCQGVQYFPEVKKENIEKLNSSIIEKLRDKFFHKESNAPKNKQ